MNIRKENRGGQPRWVIDIPYQTPDGRSARYRRDAQIQTKYGAEAEHRRLLAELSRTGTLKRSREPTPSKAELKRPTFADAVRQFKTARLATLKPSTRITYTERLNTLLIPRFGDVPLDELTGELLAELDAELARDKLAPSTRRNFHIVFRAVLRRAVDAGLLPSMPAMPQLPRVGRKVTRPFRRDNLEAIFAEASSNAQLAFSLSAFAGLRPGEVRGLRWPDVDLKAGTITIRRSVTRGEESTPKSGHQEVVPIAPLLHPYLEAAKATRKNPWGEVALTAKGRPWGEWGLRQAFLRARNRAGFDVWSVYDLRHFFVSELYRRGAPAAAIQALARHADLKTTERYADLDANDLRDAINRLVSSENDGVSGTPTG